MSNFPSGNRIAEVAALIGDVARANILAALMGGAALTAGELAWHAGVSAQTTSGHLGKLADAELITVEKQGRHRYYRLASPEVAHSLESLMALAATGPKRYRPTGPKDETLRLARTCYDHLAGRLGVALMDNLAARGHVIAGEGGLMVTDAGLQFFQDFGLALPETLSAKRPLCRTCLDWSERRTHLAGRLGAALLDHVDRLGWVVRIKGERALKITPAGRWGFADRFQIGDAQLTV